MLLKTAFMAILSVSVRTNLNGESSSVADECDVEDKHLLNLARSRLMEWVPLTDAEADKHMRQVEKEAREVSEVLIEVFLLDILDGLIYELTGKNTPRRAEILLAVSGKAE